MAAFIRVRRSQVELNTGSLYDVIHKLRMCGLPETCYFNLGLSLGLHMSTLQVIETNYRGDVSRCMLESLYAWLRKKDNVKNKGGATWCSLQVALKELGEIGVADQIESLSQTSTTAEKNDSEQMNTPVEDTSRRSTFWPIPNSCGLLPYTKELELLDKFKNELQEIISNPAQQAMALLEKDCMSSLAFQAVMGSKNVFTKNCHLINEVKSSVARKPMVFDIFLRVLESDPSSSTIASTMREDYGRAVSKNEVVGDISSFFDKVVHLTNLLSNIMQIHNVLITVGHLKNWLSHKIPFEDEMLREAQSMHDVFKVIRKYCSPGNIKLLFNLADDFDLTMVLTSIQRYQNDQKYYCKKLAGSVFAEDIKKDVMELGLSPNLKNTIILKLSLESPLYQDITVAEFGEIICEVFDDLTPFLHLINVEGESILLVTLYAPEQVMGALVVMARKKILYLTHIGVSMLLIGEEEIIKEQSEEVTTLYTHSFRALKKETGGEGGKSTMIIASFGALSMEEQTVVVSPKIIPKELTSDEGTDSWMKQEVDKIESMYRKNVKKYRIQNVCRNLPGAEQTKGFYMTQIEKFLINCTQTSALLYYTGHGEKGTGNWCFKDGVITFQDIFDLYRKHFKKKLLTIISDCSYSGHWMKQCAQSLDDANIPSCGHHTRKQGILLKIITSCQPNEEATALTFINEAVSYDKEQQGVTYYTTKQLSSGQTTFLFDFRAIRCNQPLEAYDSCQMDDTFIWYDIFLRHRICLIRGRDENTGLHVWHYVLVNENMLEELNHQLQIGTENITDYCEIIEHGMGPDPPIETFNEIKLRYSFN